jgi:two-component system, LytTR family, response regulator LytT
MKILVAEDEAIIAISLCTVLTELGYTPLEPAATSTEALLTLANEKPAMAIVDIHLGDYFAGFDVAAKLQQQGIPFIFLTALFDTSTIEKARQYAPAAYLVKPFTKQNLYATIQMSVLNQIASTAVPAPRQVVIKDGNQQVSVACANIVYIQAENKYISICTTDGKKTLLRSSFQEVAEQLNMPELVQVHKSYLVNTRYITAIKYDEVLLGDAVIPVGRTYRENLKEVNKR